MLKVPADCTVVNVGKEGRTKKCLWVYLNNNKLPLLYSLYGERHRYAVARPDQLGTNQMATDGIFGDAAFFEYFCTITAFPSSYGEYVARFPFPNDVFLPYDNELHFLVVSAYYVIISIS